MPGENCSVYGGGTCGRTNGVGMFKLPAAENEEYKKWREKWRNQIVRTRIADKLFKVLINVSCII